MRELMLKVEYLERSSIYIGKVGESNSTRIKIDAVYWKNKFSNISFEAIYRRADGISYPVKISTDENYIIWERWRLCLRFTINTLNRRKDSVSHINPSHLSCASNETKKPFTNRRQSNNNRYQINDCDCNHRFLPACREDTNYHCCVQQEENDRTYVACLENVF